MTCFKTIILKNYFAEKKVKVNIFEVPVFVTSLSEALPFCVFDYDRKIKEKNH